MSKSSNIVFNLGLENLNLIGKLVPKNTSYVVAITTTLMLCYIVLILIQRFCNKSQNKYIQKICKLTKTKIFTNMVYIGMGALLIPLIQTTVYEIQWGMVNKEVLNNHMWVKKLINNSE